MMALLCLLAAYTPTLWVESFISTQLLPVRPQWLSQHLCNINSLVSFHIFIRFYKL